VLGAIRTGGVHAAAHVTGGGVTGNLIRILPEGLAAQVNRKSWTPQPVFGYLAALGSIPAEEMEGTFNMGLGMILAVDPAAAESVASALRHHEAEATPIGEVRSAPRAVRIR
ncbi:MAG: AIR synthase-related protein, partial [Candidatus Rokuibacteriota bacterium]